MKKRISSVLLGVFVAAVSLFSGCEKTPPETPKTLEVSDTEQFADDVSYLGLTTTFTITSNTDWEITGIPSWVEIDEAQQSGNGNLEIDINITANDGEERSQELTITAVGVEEPFKFTISQEAMPEVVVPTLSVNINEFRGIRQAGETISVNITSNIDWAISDLPSWISIEGGVATGTGNATAKFIVDEYPDSDAPRDATFKISGDDVETCEIFVSQLSSKMFMPDYYLRSNEEYSGRIVVVDATTGEFTLTDKGRSETRVSSYVKTTLAGLEHYPNLRMVSITGKPNEKMIEVVDVRDIRRLEVLTLMSCYDVTTVLASNMPSLLYVDITNAVGKTVLETLDLAGSVKIDSIACSGSKVKTIDVTGLSRLNAIYMPNGELTEIKGLADCVNLTDVRVYNNKLKSLDVSKSTKISILQCAQNEISELNVSDLTRMTYLSCSMNDITRLDISNMRDLEILLCEGLPITELDFSESYKLKQLYCAGSLIENLDLSGLTSLNHLDCYFMPNLDTLNLSGCNSLTLLGATHPATAATVTHNSFNTGTNTIDLSPYASVTPSFKTFIFDGWSRLVNVRSVGNTRLENISLKDCSRLKNITLTDNVNLKTLDVTGSNNVILDNINGNHPSFEVIQ